MTVVGDPSWPADRIDAHVDPHLSWSALLIIDTQVDFVDGGASTIAGTTQVLPAIAELRRAFLAAGRPVVHVIRIYGGDDIDLVRRTAIASGLRVVGPDTPGSAIVPELRDPDGEKPSAERLLAGEIVEVRAGEFVMWKPRWSAFYRTRLDQHLRALGVDTVVVAGCNFPNCPRATIFDASERDYRVLVASDAVSRTEAHHLDELALIGALHTSTDLLVSSLAGDQVP